ncbi:hypothetical protein HYH03_005285 [Edaphochlamys debaryana]|uniref:protein-S-isoprenylcysteine alpha-carbonyl methylesterase n=1 Tax=Edaphochlamys debaryana TaxID=47281 RepID=A0A836C1G6_9CHLO|nr:hypothetical protein HYH03_005285 [Edaphochlamys debaryana]|eukprot:KAG2496886.1 hypothetical protein HYH03_005285 [Edaphochlamys debaryana]
MALRYGSSGSTTGLSGCASSSGLASDCDERMDVAKLRKLHPAASCQLSPSGSMLDLTIPFSHAASLLRRVFSEAWLLLRLAARLFSYLGLGWKWSVQLLRLELYAILLLPGFIQMIVFYVLSPRVQRSIVYGSKPRQRLDLYYPPAALAPGGTRLRDLDHTAQFPVVIYVTGGAWTIGYKAWGALLARRLSDQGVLVACLDYRNFPQGDALDMLEDVNTGIAWVLGACPGLGGDPGCVTLVGQSAGGHLAGLALIKQAQQALTGCPTLGASPAWAPSALHAFVGVSAALDLVALAEHLHRRGLYKDLLDRVMSLTTNGNGDGYNGRHVGYVTVTANGCSESGGGSGVGLAGAAEEVDSAAEEPPVAKVGTSHDASGCRGRAKPAYAALSPLEAARRLPPGAARLLPPVLLIHGTADKTVPAEGSARLGEALQSAGLPPSRCRVVLVPGKTHTAFLLEDPMRGGRDILTDSVLGAVEGRGAGPWEGNGGGHWPGQQGPGAPFAGGKGAQEGQGDVHIYGTLCPGFLCDLAGWVCPF